MGKQEPVAGELSEAACQRGLARILTLSAALAALATACPVCVPDVARLEFMCVSSEDCVEGQICAGNTCQYPSATTTQDAAQSDAAQSDAAHADTRLIDTAMPDASPVDAAQADGAPTDITLPDSVVADATQPDACMPAGPPPWWDPSYAVRFPLDVAAAPAQYTVEVALSGADASAVFNASLASGEDLRLVRHASGATEIDRERLVFDPASVVLRFRIQETGGGHAGGAGVYFLYAGNAAAGAAPADPSQIYLMFEDFESFTAGDDGAPLYRGLPDTAWRVVDDGGDLVYQASGSGRMTLEFVGQDRLDAAIEARIRYHTFVDSTEWAALQFRGSNYDLVNYVTYAAGIHRSNGAAQIRCWSTTDCASPVDWTAFSPNVGTWYQVSVRFVGASSALFVDDVQQAAVGNTWTGGQLIGLTAYTADVYFDDIKMRMAQDPEPQVQLGVVEQRCD